MRITTYLSVLAAAGVFAIGCTKKEDPATPEKKTDPAPAVDDKKAEPMADKKEEPKAVPTPEPVVEPDPVPTEEIDPTPPAETTDAAEPSDDAPAPSGDHQAVFDKGLTVMDSLFTALEEAEDVDDAVERLNALEADFKEMAEEMTAVGEPDEATAAAFNEQLEPLKAGYQERAQTAMFKLMKIDPAVLQGGTPDPAVIEKLQEDGQKLGGAVETLMGYYEGAWKNVGNN